MPRESQEEHWPGLALAVAALLRARNWTQGQLAEAVGLSRPRVNQAISSERVTPRVYEALARVFGMTPHELRAAATRMAAAAAGIAPGGGARTQAEREAALEAGLAEEKARAEEARAERERNERRRRRRDAS